MTSESRQTGGAMIADETKLDDADSSSSKLVCIVCGAELYSDFVSESQSSKIWLRCGGCGDFIDTGIKASAPVDKFARKSLWFGLSSILLLFFTGIPAIYYGIRSLLRSRFTSVRPKDRRAAIAGISLGSFFGVFVGGLVSVIAVISLVAYVSFASTEDFGETKLALSRLVNADLPAEVQNGKGRHVMGMNIFKFWDGEKRKNKDEDGEEATENEDDKDRKERFTHIHLTYFPPVMIGSTSTLKMQLADNEIDRDANHERTGSEELNWEMAGLKSNVSKYIIKATLPVEDGEDEVYEVHQYVGYVVVDKGIFGVGLTLRQPNPVFPDDESVKAFVNSIRASDNFDISGAWKNLDEANSISQSSSESESKSNNEQEAKESAEAND